MMFKRVLLVSGFIVFFGLMAAIMFHLQQKSGQEEVVQTVAVVENEATYEAVHTYTAQDLSAECSTDDHIFCAVERVVKCTMTPELDGCSKDNVPAFVLGKAKDTDRPTEISFRVMKIKPVPGSTDVSVYTESDCNAMWFGLCKGTVVYALTPHEGENNWRVTNIYALEPVANESVKSQDNAVESTAVETLIESKTDESVVNDVQSAAEVSDEASLKNVEETKEKNEGNSTSEKANSAPAAGQEPVTK